MGVIYHFSAKNFIVIGASSGMGRQIAEELAEAGAHVLAVARRQELLRQLQEKYPTNISVAVADMTEARPLDHVIAPFVAQFGKLHGAVYTAGVEGLTPLRAFSEEMARTIMETSFWGAIKAMQLINQRKFSVDGSSSVLFSSISAYTGASSMFAYSAAKAAVQAAARSIAKEICRNGKRINTISPGWVSTEMTHRAVQEAAEDMMGIVEERCLLGLGKPADVSGFVLFLLSERARWITGKDFIVDGGYLWGDG